MKPNPRTQPDRKADSTESVSGKSPGDQAKRREVAPLEDELKSSNESASVESLNH
jgi:hypothetical protein